MKLRTRHLTAAVVVLATGALLTGCGDSDAGSTTRTTSYEVVTGNVSTVDVDTDGGDIKVVAGAENTIRVTETTTYRGDRPKTEHTTAGGTLLLTANGGCLTNGGPRCRVDYTLEVPKTVAAALNSRGGDVSVTGTAGALQVKTGGGKVTADQVAAERLTVEVGGGAVDARFSAAPDRVDITTHGGSISVQVPDAQAYAVDATTTGGSRYVSVPTDPASTRTIKLHTDGGDVRLAAV